MVEDLAAVGQLLPFTISIEPAFDQLLSSETCRKLYPQKSARFVGAELAL